MQYMITVTKSSYAASRSRMWLLPYHTEKERKIVNELELSASHINTISTIS